jgi:hypothetical protein
MDARLTTLLCKKENTVTNFKEEKNGFDLAESSKEGCGSKKAMIMMMSFELSGIRKSKSGTTAPKHQNVCKYWK